MSKLIQNQLKIKSLKIGDQIEVKVGPIAHGGHFISRHNGQVVFVRHAITGEKAVVKITSTSSKLAYGDAIKILSDSNDRVKSSCKHSAPNGCGGCDFQHIEISAQKKLKLEVIKNQFMRISKIKVNPKMISTEPADGLNWRTRFDFAVSENGRIGLYASKTKDVIEIDECSIAVKDINNSGVFSKKWNESDRIRVSASSSNQLNISRGSRTRDG